MAAMNGQVLGASAMRISWGRSSSRVANQAAQQGGMGHFGGMHGTLRGAAGELAATAGARCSLQRSGEQQQPVRLRSPQHRATSC